MKTIARPVNPFTPPKDDWYFWNMGAEAMEAYYKETLQDPIGLLISAEAEIVGLILDGGHSHLRQVLILVRNAKSELVKGR